MTRHSSCTERPNESGVSRDHRNDLGPIDWTENHVLAPALLELIVEGIQTNTTLHLRLVDEGDFRRGGVSIHYLEKLLGNAT